MKRQGWDEELAFCYACGKPTGQEYVYIGDMTAHICGNSDCTEKAEKMLMRISELMRGIAQRQAAWSAEILRRRNKRPSSREDPDN